MGLTRAAAMHGHLAILLCVVVLICSGCAQSAPSSSPQAHRPSPVAKLTVVPDLRGKTVAAARELLGTDASVSVTFPAIQQTPTADPAAAPAPFKKAWVGQLRKMGHTMSLELAAQKGPTHLIAKQSAAPGKRFASVRVLRLTAGPHPGDMSELPWVQIHPHYVKIGGASQCLENCHRETDCSDCHTELM